MTRYGLLLAGAAFLTGAHLDGGEAQAQNLNPARNSYRDNVLRRPTVSPYLNLLQENGLGLPSYHTLVRPQMEQSYANQRYRSQISQLQQQVAGQTVRSRTGAIGVRPTGHTTAFMNLSHYYPGLPQRR